MENTIKAFSDSLTKILRYIASGFIGLIAYMFLNNIQQVIISKDSLFLVIVAASMGLVTYAFHNAWLDKVLYKWHAFKIFEEDGYNVVNLQNSIKDCDSKLAKDKHKDKFEKEIVSKEELKFALLTQTYMRNISTDEKIVKLQALLEQRLALLSFLYCTLYQIIAVSIYFVLNKYFVQNNIYGKIEKLNLVIVIFIIIILIIAVYKFDRRICKREIWAISQFYQC